LSFKEWANIKKPSPHDVDEDFEEEQKLDQGDEAYADQPSLSLTTDEQLRSAL